MTPEELEAQRLAEEAEAQRLAEEAEAQRLAQEAAATNPIMQPTDLIGQQGQQETVMDTNPLALAGLGGAAAFQGMFPFASEAAANSRGTTLPQLMGTGNSQFTGTNAGRLTPGTQIVPQTQLSTINQPPAVQSSGSLSTKTTTAKPGTANYAVNRTAPYTMGPAKQFASGVLKTGLIGALTTPNTMGDGTISGAYDRRVAAGEDPKAVRIDLGLDADYGDEIQLIDPSENPVLNPELNAQSTPTVADVILAKQARGPDATYTPEELAQISSIHSTDQANSAQFVQDYQDRQMDIAKSLQDFSNVDDLRAVEAQLAEKGIVRDLTTPFLDGAKSIGEANAISSFTPRSTFTRADGRIMQEDEFGQQREITADQLRQFEGDMAQLGQPTAFTAPMGVEETRARLGGRTLNEYLNAPDGTPGVYGLRTDPQGRMIPAGFETRADAYPSYEGFAAEREGRLAARMQQPGESITERDTRNAAERTQSSQNVPTDVREAMLTPEGRRTAKQINRLARWSGSTQGQEMGGVAGLEQILQPVDAQKQQYDAMRVYKLGLEIDKMQQEKPSEYQESAAEVDEAIAAGSIKPEDRNKFILRDLGWQAKGGEDSSDLMSIIYGDGAESGGEPTLVKTQEEYDNLAKGTRYIDADGNIATKK